MSVPRGAYPAQRGAALSGVPGSTVHWWARNEILVPSVSAERVKLWSYGDLMGLRIIYWLRQPKRAYDGAHVPRTDMPAVRQALRDLEELDMALWSEEEGPAIRVDRGGHVHVVTRDQGLERASDRQRGLEDSDLLEVLEPFRVLEGGRGPDLRAPRPDLRIVPGKLGGAPHVARTRLESEALGALARDGLPTAKIYRLYPRVEPQAIVQALDLEQQLVTNLRIAA